MSSYFRAYFTSHYHFSLSHPPACLSLAIKLAMSLLDSRPTTTKNRTTNFIHLWSCQSEWLWEIFFSILHFSLHNQNCRWDNIFYVRQQRRALVASCASSNVAPGGKGKKHSFNNINFRPKWAKTIAQIPSLASIERRAQVVCCGPLKRSLFSFISSCYHIRIRLLLLHYSLPLCEKFTNSSVDVRSLKWIVYLTHSACAPNATWARFEVLGGGKL